MSFFKTNDDVKIYYEVEGEGKAVLFANGWSCSSKFFKKNIKELKQNYKVISFDYRGHGQSEKVEHGYRIARFAKDTKDLLDYLQVEDVTAVGWSMGAAVLWSYLELFGDHRISKLVSIDQSPSQYIGPDWEWGQNGCYDVEMFIRLIKDIEYNEEGVSRSLAATCLNHQPTQEEEDFLAAEIMKCSKLAKIEIMRDHTNLDWRDFLPEISIPSLVFVGKKSEVFPWQGSKYAADVIPNAELEIFENCGHMLFWDEAQKFNKRLSEFIDK